MSPTKVNYESELRIGVVMYGGVSLAVYIGGVARELLSVVRATALGVGEKKALAGVQELTPVETIYRQCASNKDGELTTRVAIDVISGTSAGGINGVFLAKALAQNLSMDSIVKLWVEEGDLSRLLNDRAARTPNVDPDDPPPALFNGRHMYERLLHALDGMGKQQPEAHFDPGRVDLYITTTDVRGELVRLPVSNAVAREMRYRQRFHFTHRPTDRKEDKDEGKEDDFSWDENPLLAFAARCTSSFPGAFEPFTWNDAQAVASSRSKASKSEASKWTDRLLFVGPEYEKKPLTDGGYLDNKPFSYVVDELARRQSYLDVKRVLVYIEPDPERFSDSELAKSRLKKPGAVENALAALTLSGYETVREDLERVLERNARIRDLLELERIVEGALPKDVTPMSADEWRNGTLADLAKKYGNFAYSAYLELKVQEVAESLADAVCSAARFDRPELVQVVRELVMRWARVDYVGNERQLLLDADLDYRFRKISFVLRRLEGSDPAVSAARRALTSACDTLYGVRRELRTALRERVMELRKGDLSEGALMEIAAKTGADRAASVVALVAKLRKAGHELRKLLSDFGREVKEVSDGVAASLSGSALAEAQWLHDAFEYFDMAIFPIVRNGGIDEAVEVDIVRISPEEASSKTRRNHALAGNTLAHFGAFLEEGWREHDILSGRLDAAETIIRQLVANQQIANERVTQAHAAIIAESRGGLTKTLSGSEVWAATADDLKRAEDFRKEKAPVLDRARQVDSAGRAGVILEKVLRAWAVDKAVPVPTTLRWGVLLIAMLGQIAIPRSFARTVAAHWGRVLALACGLVAGGGFAAGAWQVMGVGLGGLAIITGLTLVSLRLASALGDRWAWKVARRAVAVVSGVAGVLGAHWAFQSFGGASWAALMEHWLPFVGTASAGVLVGGAARRRSKGAP